MNSSHRLIKEIKYGMERYCYYNHSESHTGDVFGQYNYGVIYGLYFEHLHQSGYVVKWGKLMEGQSEEFAQGVALGVSIIKPVGDA